MNIIPVLLSGGAGTRLWPVSRAGFPKQLQKLCGDETLLQQTARRLAGRPEISAPLVICSDDQRFLVAEQLREIGCLPDRIILEPVARSTAPALTVAALMAGGGDAVLVAMPADHYIPDTTAFAAAVSEAARLAQDGVLMTFGVKPTMPHTGFGYIEQGVPLREGENAFEVRRFREKPDRPTAEAYLAAGTFFWNAGIFVFRADAFLAEIDRLQPALGAACRRAVALGRDDLDFLRLDADSFAASPSISVDYAVMEHAARAGVLPIDFAWSDIGGWSALWRMIDKDAQQNALVGDVVAVDTTGSMIRSDKRLIAAVGLHDMVVIDTPDALFVAPMNRADDVKDVVATLTQKGRKEASSPSCVWRPWGCYEGLSDGDRFQVKKIMVKPGGQLSLQKHFHRAEHWVVVSGTAKVTVEGVTRLLGPNETAYIPLGATHRLENPGRLPLYLIEVQSGDYVGEDDIVRLDDVYRRGSENLDALRADEPEADAAIMAHRA
jgi:mannose-1-phosphate guanylyltransferase/mannose-6-phosphate isomerase